MMSLLGEDARKAESDYLKKQEMRRWVTEKMYHDEYKRVIQEVENKDHASMLQSLNATLGAVGNSLRINKVAFTFLYSMKLI